LCVTWKSEGINENDSYVDDSMFQQTANRRFLEKAGYKVLSAANGHEALTIASAGGPNLILLDMLLPKMTGPDVLKELKANSITSGIPVIAFSSLIQTNETRLRKDGASAYYQKSRMDLDDGSELLQLIQATLQESSASQRKQE
jgi:CheY-like chemotaxis protein